MLLELVPALWHFELWSLEILASFSGGPVAVLLELVPALWQFEQSLRLGAVHSRYLKCILVASRIVFMNNCSFWIVCPGVFLTAILAAWLLRGLQWLSMESPLRSRHAGSSSICMRSQCLRLPGGGRKIPHDSRAFWKPCAPGIWGIT